MTFNYAGGKSKLANQIIKYFPKHEVYIEPFGGSAKILFAKNPSQLEVYNDIDEGLSAIFICLANPRLRKELISKIEETLPSRKLFDQLKKQKPRTYVMRAFRKLYLLYYSYASQCSHFKSSRVQQARTHRIPVNSMLRMARNMAKRRIVVESLDYRKLIEIYAREHSLIYCDPPYYEVCKVYEYDFAKEDHQELRDYLHKFLSQVDCTLFLSYNEHPVIREFYEEFYFKELEIQYTISVNRTNPKVKNTMELLISNKPFKEYNIYNMRTRLLTDFC